MWTRALQQKFSHSLKNMTLFCHQTSGSFIQMGSVNDDFNEETIDGTDNYGSVPKKAIRSRT